MFRLHISSKSLSDQKEVLEVKQSRQTFDQAKDDSSSLICLRDSASFRSSWTSTAESSSLLSKVFGFDGELLESEVYKRQAREFFKRVVRKRKAVKGPIGMGQQLPQVPIKTIRESRERSDKVEMMLTRDKRKSRLDIKILLLGTQSE